MSKSVSLKVSIIMPVYKASETIKQAVESVISQSYENWELIIINDCCPNNSCNEIKSLVAGCSKIKQINNRVNKGVAASRNIGISIAQGEILAFLDSDDYWHQDKLMLQIIKIKEGFDIISSNYFRLRPNSKNIEVFHKEIFNYLDMLKSNQIGNLTGIYRCDYLGKFYQKNIGHEDYLMWLQIIRKAERGYCVQQPLAYYRVSEDSVSSNKLKAITWQWKIYRQELQLNLVSSLWLFLNYLHKALKKRR